MAKQRVDDLINSLRGATADLNTGAEGFKQASQLDAQSELARSMPDLISGLRGEDPIKRDEAIGRYQALAARSGRPKVGDDIFEQLIKSQTVAAKPAKPGSEMATADQIKAAMEAGNIDNPAKRAASLAGTIPVSEIYKAVRSAESGDLGQGNLEYRKSQKFKDIQNQQIDKLKNDTNKVIKEYDNDISSLKNNITQLKQGNQTGLRTVLSIIAKSIGRDSGALSDADIAGILPKTGFTTVEQLKNWVKGDAKLTLPDDQVKALAQTIEIALSQKANRKGEIIASQFRTGLAAGGTYLRDDQGKVDPRIKNLAKAAEAEMDDDGNVTIKSKSKIDGKTAKDNLTAEINKIPDPAKRAKVLEQFNGRSEEDVLKYYDNYNNQFKQLQGGK